MRRMKDIQVGTDSMLHLCHHMSPTEAVNAPHNEKNNLHETFTVV